MRVLKKSRVTVHGDPRATAYSETDDDPPTPAPSTSNASTITPGDHTGYPPASPAYSTGLTEDAAEISIPPRAPSPQPSVYSVSSSIRNKFFRNINGRLYGNHFDNLSYMLPADEEEKMRIENEHNIFKMMRGGKNYVGPVRQVLRPSPESPNKACLDLGCGTALWLRDMSQEFPWVTFVGVDLLPIQVAPLPPNCRIEVDDFNQDLQHFYDSYDFVHGRIISAGVSDYRRLINESYKILRPGGMLLLQDYPYFVSNSSREPIQIPLPENYNLPNLPPTRFLPDFVYTAFWIWILQRAFVAKNGRVDQTPWIETWMREHGGFEEIQTKDAWLPIGPWYNPATTNHEWGQNYLGELKRRDVLALLSGTRQLILSHGMSLEDWDELETNVVRECTTDCERLKMSSKLTAVWGRRKKNPPMMAAGEAMMS